VEIIAPCPTDNLIYPSPPTYPPSLPPCFSSYIGGTIPKTKYMGEKIFMEKILKIGKMSLY